MSKKTNIPRSPGRPKTGADQASVQTNILMTASRLFMEYGYEPVSLQQIASLCNVTKASIYYHFTSKADLFTVAITRIMMMSMQQTSLRLDEPGTLQERLIKVAQAKMQHSHIETESMMREAEKHLNTEQLSQIREAEVQIFEVLATHFKQEMDNGYLRVASPMLLAHAFTSLLMLANREDVRSMNGGSIEELARELVALFLDGAVKRSENI
ncbi:MULTISPECIES: TetR/AcrR family transcriptional regulator [Paenibacillus]|uniref:TetR/AcrR family transcriptional regulator n=1 Tax=Paenibacillus TaxID=44249 RepID=UPI000B871560|nr:MULTISPECIES: TetR/AcrR family transcriptional regulator [Paenibacillus]PRA03577.1 TetR/AcrR family transcriptional regulator [Paenibacillus sp. MYb63]PRA46995.1 TetR/AcrR family transcriptional regulator [Paenibacillus sp. MYb67]